MHIFPSLQMFGWNILVLNCSTGGLLGYSSSNQICNRNVPPSQIVSSGPKITASHWQRLSSSGTASMPSLKHFFIFCKSCSNLLCAAVDILLLYPKTMWLKKLFNKQKTEGEGVQSEGQVMEEEGQEKQSKIYTVSQNQVDLRYSQVRILKTKNLNLPQDQIQFIESAFFEERDCLQIRDKFSEQWMKVEMIITDKQILMIPNIFRAKTNSIHDHNILHIFFGMIEKVQLIQLKKEPPKLNFTLKDNRSFAVQSVMGDRIKQIDKIIKQFCFPNGINKFYAFKYGKLCKNINGWNIYNFDKQMARMKVDTFLGRNTNPPKGEEKISYQIVDNSSFQLSPTYPEKFIIPASMSEKQFIKASKFRTKERLPILTYLLQYSHHSYSSLFRCSQNKGGLLTNRCAEDQKFIQAIAKATETISSNKVPSNGKINCKIYDARGYYAALGNKIAGKGFESEQFYNCEIQFLNIPNIHAVRNSYNRIKSYNPYKEDFIAVLGDSGWIDYLYLILAGAKSMAKSMLSGKNVIVHCSDGWDRTTQLSCLTQIILDPYYRTIEGFIVLFEKDWRSTGHKFRVRSGQYNHIDYSSKQISPIFIQYLDCILQLINQFPLSFEFNIKFLNFLASGYQSYIYGTFLTNSIKEAKTIQLEKQTISIWSDVLEQKQKYINLHFRADGPKVLDISSESIDFTIWKEHFLQQKTLPMREYQYYNQVYEINRQMKGKIDRYQNQIAQLKLQIAAAASQNNTTLKP